jgi:histidine triad (HIT) family protein
MEDCIFCKITKGEIPCTKVFKNENIFAFLDINPVNKGHTLVITKKHFENIYELPENLVCELFKTTKEIGIAIKKSLHPDGINVYMNNEKAAGQVINHTHVHVIPRLTEDGFTYWKGKKIYSDEEMRETAEKITQAL